MTAERQPTNRARKRLVQKIRRVANEMEQLGQHMVFYGALGPIAKHGCEMKGAAKMAKGWADEIEKLP